MRSWLGTAAGAAGATLYINSALNIPGAASGAGGMAADDETRLVSPRLMQTIYDMYMHGPAAVRIARRVLQDHVLRGGIDLSWGSPSDRYALADVERAHRRRAAAGKNKGGGAAGGGSESRADLMSVDDDEYRESRVLQLLAEAMDWRSMFGFVPFVAVEDAAGRSDLHIPKFGSGLFVVRPAPGYQSVLYFVPLRRDKRSLADPEPTTLPPAAISGAPGYLPSAISTSDGMLKLDTPHGRIDPSVHVYVFPGYEISYDDNCRIRSDVATLIDPYLRVQALGDNLLHADYHASHPTLYTQVPAKATGGGDGGAPSAAQAETETFGLPGEDCGPDGGGGSVEGDIAMRRDEEARRSQERAAAAINAASRGQEAVVSARFDPRTGAATSSLSARRGPRVDLPAGRELSAQPALPAVIAGALEAANADLVNQIYLVTGVPGDMLSPSGGGSGASGDAKRKPLISNGGSNTNVRDVLRVTVDATRRALADFYSDAYAIAYGDRDDAFIRERADEVEAHDRAAPNPGVESGGGSSDDSGAENKKRQRTDVSSGAQTTGSSDTGVVTVARADRAAAARVFVHGGRQTGGEETPAEGESRAFDGDVPADAAARRGLKRRLAEVAVRQRRVTLTFREDPFADAALVMTLAQEGWMTRVEAAALIRPTVGLAPRLPVQLLSVVHSADNAKYESTVTVPPAAKSASSSSSSSKSKK